VRAEASAAKTWVVLWLGGLLSLSPLSLDLFTPAAADAARDLNLDDVTLAQTIAMVLVGNVAGYAACLLLSRQRLDGLLRFSLWLFLAASVGVCFVTDGVALLGLRLVQGVCVVVCRFGAQVGVAKLAGDAEVLARRHANLTLLSAVVIVVAPLVGAALSAATGWRSVFLIMAVAAMLLLLFWPRDVPPLLGGAPQLNPSAGAWRVIVLAALAGGHFAVYITNLPAFALALKLEEFGVGFWLAGQGGALFGVRLLHRAALSIWPNAQVLLGLCVWQTIGLAGAACAIQSDQIFWGLTFLAVSVVATPAINTSAIALVQVFDDQRVERATGWFGLIGAVWGACAAVVCGLLFGPPGASIVMALISFAVLALAVSGLATSSSRSIPD